MWLLRTPNWLLANESAWYGVVMPAAALRRSTCATAKSSGNSTLRARLGFLLDGVAVHVDQPRHDRVAAQVDHGGVGRHGSRRGFDGGDAAILDQQGAVLQHAVRQAPAWRGSGRWWPSGAAAPSGDGGSGPQRQQARGHGVAHVGVVKNADQARGLRPGLRGSGPPPRRGCRRRARPWARPAAGPDGRRSSPRAMFTRCCSPPEKVAGGRSHRRRGRFSRVEHRRRGRGLPRASAAPLERAPPPRPAPRRAGCARRNMADIADTWRRRRQDAFSGPRASSTHGDAFGAGIAQADAAVGGEIVAVEAAQQRAFAGTGAAGQHQAFAARGVEVDRAQHGQARRRPGRAA